MYFFRSLIGSIGVRLELELAGPMGGRGPIEADGELGVAVVISVLQTDRGTP
jgi:hypothetical protein